jgi:hypothetical protein
VSLIWIWFGLGAAAVLDLVLGTAGLPVPVLACATFYMVTVFRWPGPVFAILTLGTALDLAVGFNGPWTVLGLLTVGGIGRFWCEHGEFTHMTVHFLLGALLGTLYGAVLVGLGSLLQEHMCLALIRHAVVTVLLNGVLGALLLPELIQVLDAGARALQLPRYSELRSSAGGAHVH